MTDETNAEQTTEVARAEVKSFVERVERLEEDKKAVMDDIKDVYSEAKGRGYDTKVLKQVVARRKLDREERAEMDSIFEIYEQALANAA